ncbi:PREDICTED: uncharacterized protein LOC108567895 [Nicrophorus vespilloides]|uniref:Uncharacterized protein LOC108567895 n=1 Tax=Nicrophorus vespilloides TaxID=110193 RepID=A0ABM1NBA1_NICVS|nr:PREDICTED: uncharacterized protein LOC108567895 [Nicrophorus vespilloides]
MISLEFIVLLCTLQIINGDNLQDALTCIEPSFSCNQHDKNVVNLNGSVIRCEAGKQCNSEYLLPCDPCIDIPPKCENAFFCNENDLSKFYTDSGEFKCENGYICNAKYEHHCEPCVKKTCKPKYPWTCIKENLFIMNDSFHKCPEGTFCNKLDKYPCTPCISSYRERHYARRLSFYK